LPKSPKFSELSGGTAAAGVYCKIHLPKICRFVLMDEALSQGDIHGYRKTAIFELLQEMTAAGKTVLIVVPS